MKKKQRLPNGNNASDGIVVLLILSVAVTLLALPPAVHQSYAYVEEDHLVAFEQLPPDYYMEYYEENYAPCYECHEAEQVVGEDSEETEFRNGDMNLHRVHVVQKKGRSCKACHTTEAQSSQDSLMRDDVPFGTGGWKLPIQFTRNSTGGNCVVGCHREFSYDRDDPVKY